MTKILNIFACISLSYALNAQSNSKNEIQPLNDSLIAVQINNDLAEFHLKGAKELVTSKKKHEGLINIPVRGCRPGNIYFSLEKKGLSTHITFSSRSPEKVFDSISFVTHSHFLVNVPQNSLTGIRIPFPSCECTGTGKSTTCISEHVHAFYSNDRRHIYLRLTGESYDGAQIVRTLVFVNDRYYATIEK